MSYYGVSYCPIWDDDGKWIIDNYLKTREEADKYAALLVEVKCVTSGTAPIVLAGLKETPEGKTLNEIVCRLCGASTVYAGDIHDTMFSLMNSDCSNGICSSCAFVNHWNITSCPNCDHEFSPREENSWECPKCGYNCEGADDDDDDDDEEDDE